MNALVYVDVDQGLNKVKLISLEHFKLSVAINRTYVVRECGPHAHSADRTQNLKKSTPAQLTTQFSSPLINKRILKIFFVKIIFKNILFLEK